MHRFRIPPQIARLLRYAITLAIFCAFAWMIYRNWRELGNYSWQFHPLPFLLSLGMYAITLFLSAYIWGKIINHLSQPLRWQSHMRSYLISRLGFRLSGPLLQVPGRMLMYGASIDKRVIAFASGLELVLAILAGSLIAFFLGNQFQSVASLAWVIAAFILGGLLMQPFVLLAILKLIKVDSLQTILLRNSIEWSLYYVVIWLLGGISLYYLIGSVVSLQSVELLPVLGAWVISGLAGTLVTFLPLGLGIREITLAVLLNPLLPAGLAPLAAIFSRVFFTLFDLLIAGVAYFLIPKDVSS